MRCVGLFWILISFVFIGCNTSHEAPTAKVHEYVSVRIDSMAQWMNGEFIPLLDMPMNEKAIVASFNQGRRMYKGIEFAIEYFYPNSARNLNGPPLPEIEQEEHTVIEPGGFQVLEEMIFPMDKSPEALLREARKMKSILVRLHDLWESTTFRDDQVFDALRMECFRIITLGISGFDTPVSLSAISELPLSLRSVDDVLSFYDGSRRDSVFMRLTSAVEYGSGESSFDSFDRLVFINEYMNPLTGQLLAFQKRCQIPVLSNVYAINGNIETLFDSAAFNLNYFTPDARAHMTPEKIALGKKIFFDPVISGNGKVSCASCHNPSKAFTDGLAKNKTIAGGRLLKRNTPTLINAGLQKAQFYDMRSVYLEDQVKVVIENKDEIHGDLDEAVKVFRNDSGYATMFRQAFGTEVTQRDVQVALASYVRSLTSFNSRFDSYMRGERGLMNVEEKKGFNLFMGKAKCGICHFMPLFNGTVPPAFTFTESEVIGVPADAEGARLDADVGRYAAYQIPNFMNAFKTPTVRNVELTAPYMHNGVYKTLDEVMDFYNHGGGAGLGFQVENQTLPFDSLRLSATEKNAVIAFMKTLTSEVESWQTKTTCAEGSGLPK